ncbi:MAG: nucleoside permease [Sedimentisphaerales bacterium]|nr:nucleoside permease [Sedimentisphaerales bacterium]
MSLNIRIRLSVMMFIQFFVWGTWYVAMGPYLGELQFSDRAIGMIYSTTGLAAIISPFFVGMVADRFFAAEKIMAVLHILGGILLYLTSQITSPNLFFLLLLLHTLCYMPTLALVNAVSFTQITDQGRQFPAIRVLGTIGWIAAGLAISYLVPPLLGVAKPELTAVPFKVGAVVSLLMGLYCLTLPHTPPKSAGKKVTVRDVLGLDALRLLKEPSFTIFLISSFLICIPLSFYFAFAGKFLANSGMSEVPGKMTLGQMSEIFFMLVMPLFFIRLGVKKMLLTGMVFWLLRYLLFAFGNMDHLAFMLYLGILFHGICYDFFFVTGQIYVDKKAHENIRASAQGLIAFVTLGLGMAVGTQLSGVVADYFSHLDDSGLSVTNWRAVWIVPALMAGLVAVLFSLLFRDPDQPGRSRPAGAGKPAAPAVAAIAEES